MSQYVQHTVIDVNEQYERVQRCALCGYPVSDLQNVMWPNDAPPPKHYAAGNIYVKQGNPRITTTIKPTEPFLICKNLISSW